MTTDRKVSVRIHQSDERPPEMHPCAMGAHRWAWLTNGGQACGYCGVMR